MSRATEIKERSTAKAARKAASTPAMAIVRIRGTARIRHDIRMTMDQLKINRPNYCVIVPVNDSMNGMLHKAKDYVAYGEVDALTVEALLSSRGRIEGNKPLTDAHVAANSKYKTISELANAVAKGETRLAEVKGAKPLFRLSPPRGGFEGNKRHWTVGGSLGYRGKDINELIKRMI
jgi:large subunit ribosomal protein L30